MYLLFQLQQQLLLLQLLLTTNTAGFCILRTQEEVTAYGGVQLLLVDGGEEGMVEATRFYGLFYAFHSPRSFLADDTEEIVSPEE